MSRTLIHGALAERRVRTGRECLTPTSNAHAVSHEGMQHGSHTRLASGSK